MKYDFDLDLEARNSLSLIVNRIKPNSIVLEFGPASGRMTKYLKEALNCKVYAIELDQEAAQEAEQYCERILFGDIEKYTWLEEYKSLQFDYIVFADVLEHLYHPDKVLKKVKSLLGDNGSILMSIPNIAHNAIIMDLLQDKFTYRDIGLLDNTHIRFFTKNTLDALIEQCGLEIEYETGSYIKPVRTEFEYQYNSFDSGISSVLANREFGEVYQFVVEAKKNAVNPVIDFKREEIAVLYVDTGSGFNETEKEITSYIYKTDNKISFKLKMPFNNAISIRIDPLANALLLKSNHISINAVEVKDEILHNGKVDENNVLIFLHDEPQLTVNLENPTKIESVTLYFDSLTKIFNAKERQVQELRNLVESMSLKNRIKKLIPKRFRSAIITVLSKLIRFQYLAKKVLSYVRMNGLFFTLKQFYHSQMYKSNAVVFQTNNIDTENISSLKEKVSIVIPTYNGIQDLSRLIPQLINQKGFDDIEIVIVDSSSHDGTAQFIKNFSNIKFISIAQEDFSHSYARNLGFKNTNGDLVLFMVQDALPTSDLWLYTLAKILLKNNLAALSCTQIVNTEADLYTCYGVDRYNAFLGLEQPITKITEKYLNEPVFARKLSQLDNVACLFQADKFSQYQFRGKYAEDLDIGLRLIKDDNNIGMTSEVQVIHSHLRPAFYYMKRAMVESDALTEILQDKKNKNIVLDNELSDILASYILLGSFLLEVKKIDLPIRLHDFQLAALGLLGDKIQINSENFELISINRIVSEFDDNVVRMINVLFENNILVKKGIMFSSIHSIANDIFNYMNGKFEIVDEALFAEFCLFMLNTYAASVGAKFGVNKSRYEKQFDFMHKILSNLEKGV